MAKDKMKNRSDKIQEEELKDQVTEDVKNEDEDSPEMEKDKETEHKEEKGETDEKEKEAGQIEELQEKFEQLSDKHLRLQAEFDNFRRRTLKEKADLIKSGGETIIAGILPVVDDFERAIDSMKEIPEDDAGKQGTLLIYTKFKDFLKQNNVKEIDALHKDFDVDLHDAITKIPAPEKKLKGKVVDVVQKGYTLNDKVIRFAKVVIGE